jgi:hypothetical protein
MGIGNIIVSALLVAVQAAATTTLQTHQLQDNPQAKETEGIMVPTFWDG